MNLSILLAVILIHHVESNRLFEYGTEMTCPLLFDVQKAIHTKNLTELSTLLTPRAYRMINKKFGRIPLETIPVNTVGKVIKVNSNSPENEWIISAMIGGSELTFKIHTPAGTFDTYFLKLEDFGGFVNEQKLRENIRSMRNDEDALKLLEDIRSAVETKNSKQFKLLVSSTANFMRCNSSKTFKKMWKSIIMLPISKIPTFQNITIIKTKNWRNRIIFIAKINGRDVKYRAIYDSYHWVLDKERCVEEYPALIDQKSLGEKMAVEVFRRFCEALELLSYRRYKEIVSESLKLIKCDSSTTFRDNSFLYFYLSYKQYFDITDQDFNITDVNFNSSAFLQFVVSYKDVQNEIRVERVNQEWRIVSIRNLKCLDYSNPNVRSYTEHARLFDMTTAEQFAARYVSAHQNKNRTAFLELVHDPYTLIDGSFLSPDMIQNNMTFRDDISDLYVTFAESDGRGLTKFRAHTPGMKKNIEFRLYEGFYTGRRLSSETIIPINNQ